MPRFKWNDPRNGRLINRYVDFICKEYPTIAKGIVKQGIGDLNTWFSKEDAHDGWGESVNEAECGCLVGTTCLVAMAKYPKVARKALLDSTTSDGAWALYQIIVEKTDRDTSKWDNECTGSIPEYGKSVVHDPLFVLIYQAGLAASSEGTPIGYEGYDDEDERQLIQRQKQVIDHIEHRIRTNLNLPYPKQKVA